MSFIDIGIKEFDWVVIVDVLKELLVDSYMFYL